MKDLDPSQIHFIPLGGSEQFGVNLNVYIYSGKLMAVDCGIGFADERFPGIDLLLPDPEWLETRRKDLVGLIITHAHEDHVGAVAYLWPRLKCPIYTSEFTAALLRHKFREQGIKNPPIHVFKANQTLKRKPFEVSFVPVSHSVPDTYSLFISTKAGNIVHSGDWNLDPKPVLGPATDPQIFKDFGEQGVMAYIGDSTNANIEGRSGSESDVKQGLAKLFKQQKGRIAVTIFASNVGRIQSIVQAAASCDRQVALVGRSLLRMTDIAKECGYLKDLPDFIPLDDLNYLPRDKTLVIATGSQGETRAAMARIARGDHEVKLTMGDTAIFSARAIPGNEADINRVKNNLVAGGVKLISPDDTRHLIHVSGHPRRDEIADMLQWLRPECVVPVHGERLMLESQASLAKNLQVPHTFVPTNGAVIRLGPERPDFVDHIETGVLVVEPNRVMRSDHRALSERRKLQFTGAVHVSVALNIQGELLARPKITTAGLIDETDEDEAAFLKNMAQEVEEILQDVPWEDREDDHIVTEDLRIGVRRYISHFLGVKPKTSVHVMRV